MSDDTLGRAREPRKLITDKFVIISSFSALAGEYHDGEFHDEEYRDGGEYHDD